jgi:hypothetical protein
MLLTIFLAIVCCAAISTLLVAAVAFVQDTRLFSSAPKEVRALLKPRDRELFYGARITGWVMIILSALALSGAFCVAAWDGIQNSYSFARFFLRFVLMLTIYKAYDMIFFDWFLLCRFRFFQHYFPETAPALEGRKYGFNIRSQLLKLLVIFPALSALAAWICTMF